MTDMSPSVVSGVQSAREKQHLANQVAKRVMGLWRYARSMYYVAFRALTGVLLVAIFNRPPGNGPWWPLGLFISYVFLINVGRLTFNRFLLAEAQRRWIVRGAPSQNTTTFIITETGLDMHYETGQNIVYWPYLIEVAAAKNAWLLIGVGSSYVLPRRFFKNPAQEKAFVADLLAHLTEASRSRSRDAERFVARNT